MLQIQFWLKQACKRYMSYLSHMSQSLCVYLFVYCATLSHITLVFFFLCIFICLFGNCRRILRAFPKPSIYLFFTFSLIFKVFFSIKRRTNEGKNTLCLALALQFNTDLTEATTLSLWIFSVSAPCCVRGRQGERVRERGTWEQRLSYVEITKMEKVGERRLGLIFL